MDYIASLHLKNKNPGTGSCRSRGAMQIQRDAWPGMRRKQHRKLVKVVVSTEKGLGRALWGSKLGEKFMGQVERMLERGYSTSLAPHSCPGPDAGAQTSQLQAPGSDLMAYSPPQGSSSMGLHTAHLFSGNGLATSTWSRTDISQGGAGGKRHRVTKQAAP